MFNLVLKYWIFFVFAGLVSWICASNMKEGKTPIAKSIMTFVSRLALSVPLAIGLLIVGLIVGALAGSAGMIFFALICAIGLGVWSLTPLFRIRERDGFEQVRCEKSARWKE